MLSGSSKSISRACAPAIEPSLRRYSTVMPSTNMRWKARLRSISDGALDQFAIGILQRFGRQVGVEPRECIAHALFKKHVAVAWIRALGSRPAIRDIRTMPYRIVEFSEPAERGLFDD